MLKSTLLDVIRTFSKNELNKFEDLVRSPYFNKKDVIVNLFLEIKKYSPDFTSEELRRELVWNKLFPGKEFNYGIMKNIIHELSKLSEKFITFEFYNKNDLNVFHDLVSELDNRNVEKVISTRLLSFEKHFNNEDVKNSNLSTSDYYYYLSKIYWIKIFNSYRNLNSGYESERNSGSNYMIYNFLITLFKIFDNFRVLKFNETKEDNSNIIYLFLDLINEDVMKKVLEYSRKDSENNFKILNCYYSMYRSVSSFENPDLYFNFKSSLSDTSNLITENDFRNLCINLHNSLINQKSNNINKEAEVVDIYNMMIEKNIFVEKNGVLEDTMFNNYILNLSGIPDAVTMEAFITGFIEKLLPDKRESSYNFGMAHLNFVKGDYNKSLYYISKIDFAYFDLKYYVRNLQMMNFYELNDYEGFIFAFDSYKHFTSKNKNIAEVWKTRTSAFYNATKLLFQLRYNFDSYSFQKLKKEITGSFPAKKLWLMRKLDEFERNNK
ncbi:MAG: hypothetical protein M3R36_09830 [Bacteroidota bacterium]|nr:hypothetical protein [Bacteroidota bacterium]